MSGDPARLVFLTPDAGVLHAIQAGDQVALDLAIRSCEPKLRRMAVRRAVARCDADTLQEAGRIAIWRALLRYRPEAGPFDNYATRAVTNAMRSEIQITAKAIACELNDQAFELREASEKGPSQTSATRADCRRLRRTLRSLPGSEFDVLFLIYGCDMSERRAATVLGLSAPRVNRLRKQAINRISGAIRTAR